ncbi:lysin B [Gordonia phage Ronaldo]|uniref:Lysin B n=2 Tax=Ronaldovirus ronaldo TaxID=2734270 RepID=A0A6B9L858_9CAUD|nr:lysin B [Gordonia phage Ronaldo]AXN53593.1 serine hydrolase [Gordonia phage Ronaldo]QHB38147.1 serine hydrolase [Gordonia phage Volt]QTF81817.1 serine hydrolase [Gordonia phage Guey18]
MQRVTTYLIALAMIVASGLMIVGVGTASAAPCPVVQRYAVGGNGDSGSTGVPGNRANRMNITYPADVFQGDHSRIVARDKLNREGHAMRARCPGTRIEVYAISLGASAASTVLDWWQTDGRMNYNSAAWFYGNPRNPGNAGFGGIETVGLPNLPFYTFWGPHRWGRIPVNEVCHRNDGVCWSPRPLHRDPGAAFNGLNGYLNGAHGY